MNFARALTAEPKLIMCDEIIVMYRGQTVETIIPSARHQPQHPYSKLLFSSVPKLDPTWLDPLNLDADRMRVA